MAQYYPRAYVSYEEGEDERVGGLRKAVRALIRAPYTRRHGPIDRCDPPGRPQARVLDLGCSRGGFLSEMVTLGWEVWGVEPDVETAKIAVHLLDVDDARIFAGAAETADYPAGSFDLVTMWHVLEHLHDPRGVLEKVHQWLRPEGTIRLAVPNVESIESRIFRRYWFGLDVPRHLHHFGPQTLRSILDRSGFEIERMVPQYPGIPLYGSLYHVLNAGRKRVSDYREPRGVYYALQPVSVALLALGNVAALDVTARRR